MNDLNFFRLLNPFAINMDLLKELHRYYRFGDYYLSILSDAAVSFTFVFIIDAFFLKEIVVRPHTDDHDLHSDNSTLQKNTLEVPNQPELIPNESDTCMCKEEGNPSSFYEENDQNDDSDEYAPPTSPEISKVSTKEPKKIKSTRRRRSAEDVEKIPPITDTIKKLPRLKHELRGRNKYSTDVIRSAFESTLKREEYRGQFTPEEKKILRSRIGIQAKTLASSTYYWRVVYKIIEPPPSWQQNFNLRFIEDKN